MGTGRVIKWIGDIDQQNLDRVMGEILGFLDQNAEESITLLLCSNGGDVNVGFAFYDIMRASEEILAARPKLIVIGTGSVRSMAPLILACGDVRLLTANTTLFFHEIAAENLNAKGRLTSKALIATAEEMDLVAERYCKILVDRSGGRLSMKKMRALFRKEAVLTADEAVELGLAEQVIGLDMPEE